MPNFHSDGVNAYNNGEYEQAKGFFLQAINNTEQVDAESYLFLGKSFFLCEEQAEAIPYVDKYLELNKDNEAEVENRAYALDLLGQCYQAVHEYDKSIEFYTKAINLYPSGAPAWHNLARTYMESAEQKLAEHEPEQTLDDIFKLFNKAKILLINALKICKTDPTFLNTFAGWHEKYIEALEIVIGKEKEIDLNFSQAIKLYNIALTVCRADDIAQKNMITGNLTECLGKYGYFLFDQNRFAEARKAFSDVLVKTEDAQVLTDVWLDISATHRMEKSWEAAWSAINNARKYVPEDSGIPNQFEKLINAIVDDAGTANIQTITLVPVNKTGNSAANLEPESFQDSFFGKLSENNDGAEKWSVQSTKSGVNVIMPPLNDEQPFKNTAFIVDYDKQKISGILDKNAPAKHLRQMAATLLGAYMLTNNGVCPEKITDIVIELTPADPDLHTKLSELISADIERYKLSCVGSRKARNTYEFFVSEPEAVIESEFSSETPGYETVSSSGGPSLRQG